MRRVGGWVTWLALCLALWPASSVPLAAAEQRRSPDHIRIGLATDLESWTVHCCAHRARINGRDLGVLPPGTVVRPLLAGGAGRFTVQVSALRDPAQAERLAASLATRWAAGADSLFDAASGTYKVRIGTFRERAAAERLRDQLRAADHPQAWVVSEAVAGGRRSVTIHPPGEEPKSWDGAWVEIRPGDGRGDDGGVVHAGDAYRGALWLFVNERGRINVINELPLEQYLRGVVPREMGPASYPELEALKAQTIAARTYALSQIDAFRADGYDLCGTPKCQVYGGISAEHRLSDRAIDETRGEVLTWAGQLAETLYSASCGGHTEQVDVPFPQRQGEHLVGVPCAEAGTQRLVGVTPAHALGVAGQVAHAVVRELRDEASDSAMSLDELTRALARRRGLEGVLRPRTPQAEETAAEAVGDSGTSNASEAGEVGRQLAARFDLALDTELIRRPEALVEILVGRWRRRFDPQAVLPVAPVLDDALREQLVAGLALELGVLRFGSLQHHAQSPDHLMGRWLPAADQVAQVTLRHGGPLVLFAEATTEAAARALAEVELIPGDVGLAVVLDDRLLALGVTERASIPEVTTRAAWRRSRTGAQLQKLIGSSLPGFELGTISVARRGRSGRVAELQLTSRNGSVAQVEGLAVRWTLDLPDTLFSLQLLHDSDAPVAEQRYLFRGRGWGHGVGLCQLGAVNMARFGSSYREILAHYYGGATVQPWRPGSKLMASGHASEGSRDIGE